MSARLFGQPVRRVEDPAMLRNAARFLDDLPAGEALHLAVVRSTVAHGRVDTLDAGEALALPGVVAVATAADLGPRNGPFPHPTWFPPSDRLRAAVDPLDAGEALALPGVVAVATAADLGPRNGPFPHPTWFPPSDRLRAAVDPL